MRITDVDIDWGRVGNRRVGERREEILPIPADVRLHGDRRHRSERRQPTENFLNKAQGETKEAKVLQGMLKAIKGDDGNGDQTASTKEAKVRQRMAQQAAQEVMRRSKELNDVLQQTADQLRATKVIDRTVPKVEDLLAEVAAQLNAHDVGGKVRQSIMGNFVALRRTSVISPNMPPGSASLAALLHSTLRVIDPKARPLLNWDERPCPTCPEPQGTQKYRAAEATTEIPRQEAARKPRQEATRKPRHEATRKARAEVKTRSRSQMQQTEQTS